MALRQEYLDSYAEDRGITNPPTVDVERWVTADEDAAVQAQCLTEQGFPAKVVMNGVSFDPPIPESQDAALALATYTCLARFPKEAKYLAPPTDEQYGVLYDYWTEYYIPCAKSRGIDVSNGEIPTREAFIARWRDTTSQDPKWTPDLATTTGGDGTLTEVCSSMPPSDAFYG
ncbi:MAG: hypothetical protein L0L69_09425 [Propionibacterium sp.]|nr:hypothetical protein [Propionibacterium sp.]